MFNLWIRFRCFCLDHIHVEFVVIATLALLWRLHNDWSIEGTLLTNIFSSMLEPLVTAVKWWQYPTTAMEGGAREPHHHRGGADARHQPEHGEARGHSRQYQCRPLQQRSSSNTPQTGPTLPLPGPCWWQQPTPPAEELQCLGHQVVPYRDNNHANNVIKVIFVF